MLDRRSFLSSSLASSLAATRAANSSDLLAAPGAPHSLRRHITTHPLALTMWDFSWLERRWPGAGYEDWDLALDELKARGYDGVRIDAYPHLIHADAGRPGSCCRSGPRRTGARRRAAACACNPR